MTRQPDKTTPTAGSVFTRAVLAHFGYLTAEFGFRCVRAEDSNVRFERDRVYVAVYHDRYCDQ